ncbi:hypothetical protein K1719_045343 [Acacia pycnantha]|nr:hypothetical protein K1719_045343 [Acacia pycnantha]
MFSKGFVSVRLINSVLVLRTASLSNETLTKYAAVDIGEEQLNQEIQKILAVDSGSQPQLRPLRWLEFRRVLSDWAQKKRFEPNIMSELTRLVKHPIDMVMVLWIPTAGTSHVRWSEIVGFC